MTNLFDMDKPAGYDRWIIIKQIGKDTWLDQSEEHGFFRTEEDAKVKAKKLGSNYGVKHIVI